MIVELKPSSRPDNIPAASAPVVTSARWADAGQTIIAAEIGGRALLVPDDMANADRQAIAAAGITIAAHVPPQADRAIHKAWLRAALADIGRIAELDAAVQSAGPVPWELWSNATTISQDDPDVTAIAAALNIDLAAVFTAARAIRTARGG